MRNGEKALSVLEALREREQASEHGWVLDAEFLPPQQQNVNPLENQGWWSWPAGRTARSCRHGRVAPCGGRPV
ncbi:hypothetical protein [Streptomyces sp. NBC_00564]|uniref:hypothetical protein n=1 Tax=Streptomyces sp. NBC_00564 TaxID=2903663 RepID=UPI002FCD72CB|nr:hypothetical protein OG256_45970 [Streptomyces sp. NBC_00564]